MGLAGKIKTLSGADQATFMQGFMLRGRNIPLRFDMVGRDELALQVAQSLEERGIEPSSPSLTGFNKWPLYVLLKSLKGKGELFPQEFYAALHDEPFAVLDFFAALDDKEFRKRYHEWSRLGSLSPAEMVAETIHQGVIYLDEIFNDKLDQGIYRAPSSYYPGHDRILAETEPLLPPKLGHFVFKPGTDPLSTPRIPITAKPDSKSALTPRFMYLLEHMRMAQREHDERYAAEVRPVLMREHEALTPAQRSMLARELMALQPYLPADPQQSLF